MPALALTPRPTAAAARLVDPRVLAHFGFTDHALERFAQRVGIHGDLRRDIEPILRDLLVDGTWAAQPPHWARTSKPADTYLQIGTWMGLLGRGDAYVESPRSRCVRQGCGPSAPGGAPSLMCLTEGPR